MSKVLEYLKSAGSWVYTQFRTHPGYAWPTAAFAGGWAIGRFWH